MNVCKCGCNELVGLAKRTDKRYGLVKGQPISYLTGHSRRKTVAPFSGYVVNNTTGCWEWMLAKDPSGYGISRKDGKKRSAHIVEWERVNGERSPNMEIDHLCKNVSCVNPLHLEQVTPTENKRRSSATKIDVTAAAEIKSMTSTPSELAKKYGVTVSNISHIRRGTSWADVKANK